MQRFQRLLAVILLAILPVLFPLTAAADGQRPSAPAVDASTAPSASPEGFPSGAPEVPAPDAPATSPSQSPEVPAPDAPATSPSQSPEVPAPDAPATSPSQSPEVPAPDAPATSPSQSPEVPSSSTSAVPSTEGFAAHLEAVKSALQRGELKPGHWVIGTDLRSRLQTLRGVQLDLAPFAWAEGFTMRLDGPSADDVLVAAGVALASGRPSIYLVNARADLPWFLREADRAYPNQVAIIESTDPLAALQASPPALRGGLSSREQREPRCDAFIGCVMSGLTDPQQVENRLHLRAIESSLHERLGCSNTFCEGTKPSAAVAHDASKEALIRDLTAIRNSRRCVFYVYDKQPRPSGVWVEVGVALALDRPTVILTPDLVAVPPSLRRAFPTGNARIRVYGTHTEMLHMLEAPLETPLTP